MNSCECGHGSDEHCDGLGRCVGECFDSDYGTFNCLCPNFIEEKA